MLKRGMTVRSWGCQAIGFEERQRSGGGNRQGLGALYTPQNLFKTEFLFVTNSWCSSFITSNKMPKTSIFFPKLFSSRFVHPNFLAIFFFQRVSSFQSDFPVGGFTFIEVELHRGFEGCLRWQLPNCLGKPSLVKDGEVGANRHRSFGDGF